jgi:hypothetical protein
MKIVLIYITVAIIILVILLYIVKKYEKKEKKYKNKEKFINPLGQKYPPVPMTAATTNITGQSYGNGVYVASASSEFVSRYEQSYAFGAFNNMTEPPPGAFDNLDSKPPGAIVNPSIWNTASAGYNPSYRGGFSTNVKDVGNVGGEWVDLLLPAPILLTSYSLQTRNNGLYTQTPSTWLIVGSNDGGKTWIQLDTQSNITYTQNEKKFFDIKNPSILYNKYRIIIKAIGNANGYASIGDLSFYSYDANAVASGSWNWNQKLLENAIASASYNYNKQQIAAAIASGSWNWKQDLLAKEAAKASGSWNWKQDLLAKEAAIASGSWNWKQDLLAKEAAKAAASASWKWNQDLSAKAAASEAWNQKLAAEAAVAAAASQKWNQQLADEAMASEEWKDAHSPIVLSTGSTDDCEGHWNIGEKKEIPNDDSGRMQSIDTYEITRKQKNNGAKCNFTDGEKSSTIYQI